MPVATSPLRYPGGKACLLDPVSRIMRDNKLERGHYAEPYAGGCGLALGLLYGGFASDIHINDIDESIWSFWYVVLHHTEEFIALIEKTPVNIVEWHRQRDIIRSLKAGEVHDPMTLAFAVFFLNRTNRSGIIKKAGVIGGISQNGTYLIDCRFNKDELIRRIRRIGKYRNRIHLYKLDALEFMSFVGEELPPKSFLYIDPPYFKKGSSLYMCFYTREDHEEVADCILGLKLPWILTYDECEEVSELYASRRQYQISLKYSANVKRQGAELLIASKGLRMPEDYRALQLDRSRVWSLT